MQYRTKTILRDMENDLIFSRDTGSTLPDRSPQISEVHKKQRTLNIYTHDLFVFEIMFIHKNLYYLTRRLPEEDSQLHIQWPWSSDRDRSTNTNIVLRLGNVSAQTRTQTHYRGEEETENDQNGNFWTATWVHSLTYISAFTKPFMYRIKHPPPKTLSTDSWPGSLGGVLVI